MHKFSLLTDTYRCLFVWNASLEWTLHWNICIFESDWVCSLLYTRSIVKCRNRNYRRPKATLSSNSYYRRAVTCKRCIQYVNVFTCVRCREACLHICIVDRREASSRTHEDNKQILRERSYFSACLGHIERVYTNRNLLKLRDFAPEIMAFNSVTNRNKQTSTRTTHTVLNEIINEMFSTAIVSDVCL